ncbi:hypothetical protein SAMN05216298_3690 [Glycomyces sambucus]|uniref:Uncharacterized protein n=1 Tax=Glycomyces sambucus TaxID=380244 RepID=A0A1G9JKD4_9ACTN|nr:hypothetical protein [Glycomyces sambucus]SDL37742.1 hypothetical protein SAMN05216298_3690 [Glycomyces sambucus]
MPPADEAAPHHGALTIRTDRLRCALIAAVGIPLGIALILLDPVAERDPVEMLLSLAGGMSLGWGSGALGLLFREPLRFDVRSRRLHVPRSSNWRFTDVYPSPGFDRIEYSPYNARIYQVRADGRRRRLPVFRQYTNRRDWAALADLLLEHSGGAPAQTSPNPHEGRIQLGSCR